MGQARDWTSLLANPTELGAVRYARKYAPQAKDFKPESLLAGVHKARMVVGTEEQQCESGQWLRDHGYRETIGGA